MSRLDSTAGSINTTISCLIYTQPQFDTKGGAGIFPHAFFLRPQISSARPHSPSCPETSPRRWRPRLCTAHTPAYGELVLSQSLIRGVIQRLRILEPADISLLLYIAASISAWIGYNALSDAGLVDIFVRHYFVLIHFSLTLTYICKDANFDLTNIGAKSQFPSSLLDPLMSSANAYRHL